ncbi:MAG: PQQ-binding-like beta-propeller repeat protein [Methanotrichaceae archaeon]|nr:PQQ-binding-like beta-propeller repeat protein [Methanotrichaceae archaeon]
MKSEKARFSEMVLLIFLAALLIMPTWAEDAGPVPPEVLQYSMDWPLPNKDYDNSRASFDVNINSENAKSLKMVWSVPINASSLFGGASSNPLIMGNTVYLQDLQSNVYSLNLMDGRLNWQQIYNLTTIGPNGPAVGWGKVFFAKGVYKISALDRETGNMIWERNISDKSTVGIDIQPAVYNHTVYVSTVPGTSAEDFYSGGSIGVIYALDQQSGRIKWNFSTVDTPDLWGNREVNSGGGCWYTPSVDLKTGIMFWGVGNPAPWPGTPRFPNGSSRPGPNLYTNSILALDSSDGRLVWYNQVNPHDILDLDFQIPPILARAEIGGTAQEIVIGAGKLGKIYAFNRSTGCTLWTTIVGTHLNDQLAKLPQGVTKVYPGYFGGVETPMAYAEGVVFVPYLDLYTNYTDSSIVEAQSFDQAKGGLVAIDVETGKILWEKTFDSINVGGATVINDLVFTATFDGTIYAFLREDGREAWRFEAPAGINAWPAVAGDSIVWPCGTGGRPSLIALSFPKAMPIGP